MVYKESPLCFWGSAFGLESAKSLPACSINLLPESIGALSVSVWALRQQLLNNKHVFLSLSNYFILNVKSSSIQGCATLLDGDLGWGTLKIMRMPENAQGCGGEGRSLASNSFWHVVIAEWMKWKTFRSIKPRCRLLGLPLKSIIT
jgi:hypothetical protein